MYADNITFRNWIVDNGDDSISMKANSTNILIENCDFYTGLGIAIGSIGQYGNLTYPFDVFLCKTPEKKFKAPPILVEN